MFKILSFIGYALLLYALYVTLRILFYVRKAIAAGKRTNPASRILPGAEKRILVVGDSTAYGTGALDVEKTMVGRLVQDFPKFEIINKSENGIAIDKVHDIIKNASHEHFDVIIIHIGGIDTLAFSRSKTIVAYMDKIYELSKKMGAPHVVLVSMNNAGSLPLMLFPLTILYDIRSKKLTELFAQVCATHGFTHVPLYTPRNEEPLLQGHEHLFSDDKIHPNDTGYGIWYDKIKDALCTFVLK